MKNNSCVLTDRSFLLFKLKNTYEARRIAAVPTSCNFPLKTDMHERNLSRKLTAK